VDQLLQLPGGFLLNIHVASVEEVKQLLHNGSPHVRHNDGEVLGATGQLNEHASQKGGNGRQDNPVSEELAIVTLQGDVGEEPVLLAKSGNGDDVAVVTLEGDHPLPS